MAGNTKNAQTWLRAQSPWKTAVASERAGLTDAFETGIETTLVHTNPVDAQFEHFTGLRVE